MNDKFINIVLTGDDKYTMPLGVTMTSVLLNLSKDRIARFFVFADGFSEQNIKKLNEIKKIRNCEIIIVQMEQYVHLFSAVDVSKFENKYINLVCYYRLLMLNILPDNIEKCFYIDGDMIIDTDLSIIYDSLPEDKLASVVVEILAMQKRKSVLKHFYDYPELENFSKNSNEFPYFNAGFFLLNIKKAKEENLFKKAFEFLKHHPNPPYADQDTLNFVMGQHYTKDLQYLDPSFNVFCDIDYEEKYNNAYYPETIIKKAFLKPKIYHYGGANKPWINNKIKYYYDKWWFYCDLSPWKELRARNYRKPTIRFSRIRVSLFGFIPLFRIRKWNHKTKIYLFDFLFVLKIWIRNHKIKIYLFGLIPILKILKDTNKYKIYLFCLLPIINIKRA